jgi:hypothetical protein
VVTTGELASKPAAAGLQAVNPFPVAPGEVPPEAVRFLQRRMLRAGNQMDEYEAQVIVAGLIGLLAQRGPDS